MSRKIECFAERNRKILRKRQTHKESEDIDRQKEKRSNRKD